MELLRTLAIFGLLGAQGFAQPAVTAIRAGKLWDGSGKIWNNALIVIEGDRIRSVGEGAAPAGATVIDLGRYTVTPGLIDAHVHMTYNRFRNRQPTAVVYLSQENARKTLATGCTTVRNLGASDYGDIAMRDLIKEGLLVGPRMFVSGYGLHIPRGARPAAGGLTRGSARGPEEVRRAATEQIEAGADWVKMFGSTGSFADVTGDQTFSYEEMKAGVDTAHAAGKRIAIHSYGPNGARDAVRAGTDSLEHATDMDEGTIGELARRKIFYVPTIDHNRYYAENAAYYKSTDEQVKALKEYTARNLETARQAFRAGVRFAMGSDAVYTMFGENTRELEWFVKAGMTPEQALRTATTNGAALLGMESSLGAVAPGYFADLVAVDGDPLSDITAVTRRVRWVMKGGAVVFPDGGK